MSLRGMRGKIHREKNHKPFCRTDIWEEEKYVVINRSKAVNSANSDVRGLSLEITTSKFSCFVFQLVERATDLE